MDYVFVGVAVVFVLSFELPVASFSNMHQSSIHLPVSILGQFQFVEEETEKENGNRE